MPKALAAISSLINESFLSIMPNEAQEFTDKEESQEYHRQSKLVIVS